VLLHLLQVVVQHITAQQAMAAAALQALTVQQIRAVVQAEVLVAICRADQVLHT
jgi:hypothetical protein